MGAHNSARAGGSSVHPESGPGTQRAQEVTKMGIRVPEKGAEAENTTLGQTTPGYIPREKHKKTHTDSLGKAKTKL